MNELILVAVTCWVLALGLGLGGRGLTAARWLLVGGAVAMVTCTLWTLPGPTPIITFGFGPASGTLAFQLQPQAAWLALFGYIVAIVVCVLGTPATGSRGWTVGVALSLFGALGVFGLQDAVSFLIAWEIMSLGGACMLLGERLDGERSGASNLFMLALLETGAVALIAAMLVLSHASGSLEFSHFSTGAASLPTHMQIVVGLLLLIGFGAKLGVLPFYEWFPRAYSSGSGASGGLLSGVVLNAAFFALARGLTAWLPANFVLGTCVIALAMVSAILAILYAFQEKDWRKLLSFSTAENANISIALLGASILFRVESLDSLAALAWLVALLHLAAHALAKGALFCAADGVYRASDSYDIAQRGWLRRSSWLFGMGAVFSGMSLAAMPPQAGFVSEWFAFQTLFQGFHLPDMAGRLVLALAGVGLALTAAIAFATFVKVIGLGTQGDRETSDDGIPLAHAWATGILGLIVLALAVGMPWWLPYLDVAADTQFHTHAAQAMHSDLILVPLTSSFAFISPSMLVVICPLLALLPLIMLRLAMRRHKVRRSPVWYGGFERQSPRVATTALTFSNAMRVFYSFVYRPTLDVAHEHREREYFVHRLRFSHDVAALFEPLLFAPLRNGVMRFAAYLQRLQSGHMNFYLALVGLLLVIALCVAVY